MRTAVGADPWALGLALVALAGAARAEPGIRAEYRCGEGPDAERVTVFFFNQTPSAAVLLTGRQATRLAITHTASGARYGDAEQSFWVKGDRALWERGQAPALRCEQVAS
ncbi:MliC family protein [Synechococcus sp. GFB01]|uniref:MliC family protein n=1 Tax=Synechococcus sp. GFB01 TaxID=1662190 RepID=UPI000AB3C426|nr:MliC family protein [Synechococcus sp. GFB01]